MLYYNQDYNNRDYKEVKEMFIGRETELQFLEDKYKASGGQLVVVYGRRRVGKTETLRQFCQDKEYIFYACTESPDEQQLKAFSERILQKNANAAKYIKQFSDWNQALSSLGDIPTSRKLVLVIDEFPYMVKGNQSIPSILQALWDEKLNKANVMIILCGSAMSFIEKEILAEKNPLYGRTTGILKMKEMDFYDAVKFFPNYTYNDKITAYAILGGIPHYLKQFSDKASLDENIVRNILTPGSILYSEVEFLMRQELRETAVYNTIITAVALGNTKLNDIYQKTQIEKSKLSSYLKNLIDLGIIQREFPVTDGTKEQANVQRGLYQVTDKFFRFWYAFVFPTLSELEAGDARGILEYVIQPELEQYTSRIFEDVCLQYLRRKNKAHELPFHFVKIGRWWNKTDEIDIVAVDRQNKKYILAECKYKNSKLTLNDYIRLKEKFNTADTTYFYWLFSKNGFTDELKQEAPENTFLVSSQQLWD